jgi:hypothetical protein
MAGLKGKSGPPSNMNAFKHGLMAIQKRREEGIPTEYEENVRQQILEIDSGQGRRRSNKHSHQDFCAEVIASDARRRRVKKDYPKRFSAQRAWTPDNAKLS